MGVGMGYNYQVGMISAAPKKQSTVGSGYGGMAFNMGGGGTSPGADMSAARTAANQRASYLSSMDQFYAGLNEQKREFDLSLAYKGQALSEQSSIARMGIQSQEKLGMRGLDIQEAYGKGQLDLQGRGLDIQEFLGGRSLDIQELLGKGQLDLQDKGLDIQKLLGLGAQDVQRHGIDQQTKLGLGAQEVQRLGIKSQERIGMEQIGIQGRQLDFQEDQYGDMRRDQMSSDQKEEWRKYSSINAGGMPSINLSIWDRLYGQGGSDDPVASGERMFNSGLEYLNSNSNSNSSGGLNALNNIIRQLGG